MTRTVCAAWTLCALLAVDAPTSVASDDGSDHPLISRYPESKKSREDVQDYAEYALITGLNEELTEPTGETIAGKLTRIGYYSPQGRSILEIFRNYEQALEAAGAELLFQCKAAECGPSWASSAWGRFNGVTTATGGDKHYVAAKLSSGKSVAYVAVFVMKNRHQIDILEVQEMDRGLVVVDAGALGDALEREGRVVLGGVYFDFGKATLKPESNPALEQVALLLEQRDGLELFVVGHTDMVGSLETNLALSRDRAAAVVRALAEDHGVDRGRLEPHGVGPLAPRGTNASDSGREKNRRVELVSR